MTYSHFGFLIPLGLPPCSSLIPTSALLIPLCGMGMSWRSWLFSCYGVLGAISQETSEKVNFLTPLWAGSVFFFFVVGVFAVFCDFLLTDFMML